MREVLLTAAAVVLMLTIGSPFTPQLPALACCFQGCPYDPKCPQIRSTISNFRASPPTAPADTVAPPKSQHSKKKPKN
jgi:hypothetical protein